MVKKNQLITQLDKRYKLADNKIASSMRGFFSRLTNHSKLTSSGIQVAPRCLNPKRTRSANAMIILPHYYVFDIFQQLYSPLNSEVPANKGDS